MPSETPSTSWVPKRCWLVDASLFGESQRADGTWRGTGGGLEGVASFVEASFGTMRLTRPSREPKGTRREQNGCESAERSRLEPRRLQNAPMSLEGRDVQVAYPLRGAL
jgi:hypothetical protein